MSARLRPALSAALVALVCGGILMGMQLRSTPSGIQIHLPETARLWALAVGVLAVFVVQLTKDYLLAGRTLLAGAVRIPAQFPRVRGFVPEKRVLAIILLLVLVSWPFVASRAHVDLATLALIYVMLGLGLNVVVGFAGLLDLGYVGFYAVGAYSYALLSMYFNLGFWAALPIAGALAALFGFLLGFPVLRLRGDYLAIVTLGFGEIIRILLNNWTGITGGPNGITGIEKPTLFGISFSRRASEGMQPFHEWMGIPYSGGHKVVFLYLLALGLVVLSLMVIHRLQRMPLGRAWEALREDEIACRSLGLNPTFIKLTAFTIGASFAGFAGCFFAARQGFISPESFTFIESAIILVIVVLGGMGSQPGVVLAAILMTVLPEIARSFNEYRMLLFGLTMILMMLWRPQGLVPIDRPRLHLGQRRTRPS
jgi:branched-chain amino acid transport system permease protein